MLLLSLGLSLCRPAGDKRLSLLFITFDALRADHLGFYGYPRTTSPNIDGLARRSLVFRNAFTTAPKTGPAMTSFFTGRYVHHHGVTRNSRAVPGEERMLAELLQGEFATGAVVSNAVLDPVRGYDAGFGHFRLVRGTAQVSTHAMRWLQRRGGSRFFLWLHYIDPHGPYRPPRRLREVFVGDEHYDPSRRAPLDYTPTPGLNPNYVLGAVPRYQRLGDVDVVDYYVAQYDAEVRYVDEQVARVLRHLEVTGLDEKTLVVLTADHGESLGEHDYYFEHGMLLDEGSIHVPLIIRHPRLEEPRQIEALVQSTDVLPTLLTLLGVDPPAGVDGVDLSGLLEDGEGSKPPRDFVYACTPFPGAYLTFFEAIRIPGGKFVRDADGRARYFELSEDPGETTNRLSSLDPAARDRWLSEFDGFSRSDVGPGREPALPEELRERLETLGYVDP